MTFAFYDFETTGTNPAFDQPLQFAAILTDDDFLEIDRINIRCRLAPHILPAPMAMAITNVTPSMLMDRSLPSWFEFAEILRHRIDKWSPACWTGYNSIRFDEEVLRQSFYQNLQPEIFLTQTNGNQRMDMLRAVQSVRMLAQDTLTWPEIAGKPTYKLDQLAPANGFSDHKAHDALGDVLATIHLARRIQNRAPELWSALLSNRNKADVISRLSSGRPMVLIENHFGRLKVRKGSYCGVQDNYMSAAAFFDLEASDPSDLVEADDDTIFAALSGERRRIVAVATNRDPSLFDLPDPPTEIVHRAEIIASRPDFHRRVGAALARRYQDRQEPADVEKLIYSGFYTSADKALLTQFQVAKPPDRKELLNEIADERLRKLGHRILLNETPNLFADEHLSKAAVALAERWTSELDRNGWNTDEQVRNDLLKVKEMGLATEAQIEEIRTFVSARISSAAAGEMPT